MNGDSDDIPARLTAALAGRYTLGRELGSGGMATVYLAEDQRHRRPVAVKVLRPDLAAALGTGRFLREIEVAARLQHPHILPLLDSGEADGFLFYVMPYVQGESLRARLTREGELPVADAVRVLREVVDALAHAHQQGVVHRDIKPENVLLSGRHAVVADFGIAKAVVEANGAHGAHSGSSLTTAGVAVGTPAYMAPEQAAAEPSVDHRADLYAVGVLAYELLTGRPPFTGPSAASILVAHVTAKPTDVAARRPDVPPALAALVMRCLEKDPARRPQHGEEVLQALDASSAARAQQRFGPVATSDSPTVVVLPLANLSASVEDEYFVDGMTDDVIAQLSLVRGLRVISRTSAMRFKGERRPLGEIARAVGATHVVEGSVRRAGTRLRVVARLIQADTDEHLWAATFDRELTDVFAVQSEVAERVAAALRARLTTAERARLERKPTNDLEAYNLFLLGRHHYHHFGPDSLAKARECYRAAIARDARFARALAALGMTHNYLGTGYWGVRPRDAYPEGERLARRALDLDPDDADAHTTLGSAAIWYHWDWAAGEAYLGRALELNPSHAWAHMSMAQLLVARGQFDEALRARDRAVQLDPSSPLIRGNATHVAGVARRVDEVMAEAWAVREMLPGTAVGEQLLGWAHLYAGTPAEAIEPLRRARLLAPDPLKSLLLAWALAAGGRPAEARDMLRAEHDRACTEYVWPLGLAIAYAHLGEASRALDFLEQAYADRVGWLLFAAHDPALDPLRGEPRFEAVRQAIVGPAETRR